MGEHGAAQAGDEVRFCGCFAQGGDEVVTTGVGQRTESGANGEGAALEEGERDMAGVVGRRAVEDGEGAGAERGWECQEAVEDPEGGSCGLHLDLGVIESRADLGRDNAFIGLTNPSSIQQALGDGAERLAIPQ